MALRKARCAPNTCPVVIELKDVCKTYGDGEGLRVDALKDVDLRIYEGEFVAIMGPSGSGKSTMMHLVGCLDLPSCGKIFLAGKNIAEMSESDLAEVRGRKIGFVFQRFNLINSLDAVENVMLPEVFQGIAPDARRRKAIALLEKVGLGKRMYHKPSELSGGEQQRVAIARALVVNPQVILADEPTGNLDSKTGEEVMALLKKLNEEGKTIVLVTHDAHVAAFAHRVVRLRDGMIEA
ncbi:MAG: ABC transporter ATP-binding protein [Candidatus Micrarchaeia archaeon]